MPAPRSTIPASSLDAYDRLLATLPGVERRGATMPYTSVNGHMWSFLSPAGELALRLPAAERAAFLERFDTTLMESQGTQLKEHVRVLPDLLADTATLAPHLAAALAHAASLPPKPTRRR